MSKKKNSALIVVLGLYLFVSVILNFFMATQNVSAAKNLTEWTSTKGNLDPADITSSRFTFIDPANIKDNVTGATYKTSASGDELYSDRDDTIMRDPGWFWYWPNGSDGPTKVGEKCTGALVLQADPGSGKTTKIKNLRLYAVGAANNGGCYVPNGSASDNDGKQGDTKGKGDNPNDKNEYELSQLSKSTFRMAVAMFSWSNNSTINVYDSSNTLRKLTDAETGFVKDRQGNSFFSGKTAWTSPDCKQDNGFPDAFILVDNSSKDVGRVYYDQDGKYRTDWLGREVRCFFGRTLSENQSVLAESVKKDSNVVYVAHSEKASEQGTYDDGSDSISGTTDANTNSNPDCEGGGLSWVICPVVEGLANLSDAIVNNILQPILRVELLALPSSSNSNEEKAVYGAWKAFRNIANALLVLAFLAIIISTAFSSE